MHARELLELASLVAHHGQQLVQCPDPISDASLESYWVASKSRLDRWGQSLKELTRAQPDAARRSPAARQSTIALVEEILTGEVLTRVWSATMHAYDRHRGEEMMEPIARSVMMGQLEARHRVLLLLVRSSVVNAEEAVKLNRLRRRTERWTDLLIGHLDDDGDLSQYAINPDRARDFAEDLRHQRRQRGGHLAWPLMLSSLRAAFGQGMAPASPNADLNVVIAESVLSCFRPGLFGSTGVPESAWLLRLAKAADDVQGMIGLLAHEERIGTRDASRLRNRLRRGEW